VILWNDDDHGFEYVIHLMQSLFGHTRTMGRKIANEVHHSGRAVCLTTTREHAELKRDQIHAFGRDRSVDTCQGSMWATIEPVSE
jgi:ATP-dependent Clp protease adaptor protein ClpS